MQAQTEVAQVEGAHERFSSIVASQNQPAAFRESFCRDHLRQDDCDLRASGFADHDWRRQARRPQREGIHAGGKNYASPVGFVGKSEFPVSRLCVSGTDAHPQRANRQHGTLKSMELRIDFMT